MLIMVIKAIIFLWNLKKKCNKVYAKWREEKEWKFVEKFVEKYHGNHVSWYDLNHDDTVINQSNDGNWRTTDDRSSIAIDWS